MSAEIIHLRTIINRPRLPLQGANLDRAIELHGEKHSKLAAARAAGRRGDFVAKRGFWQRCKEINRELWELNKRRPRV